MLGPVLLLMVVGFVLGVPLTLAARALGHRLNALDAPGVRGQVKAAPRRVPNTGGIAIFWAFAAPLLAALGTLALGFDAKLTEWVPALKPHLPGLHAMAGRAWVLLVCAAVLHIVGLIDDRRPLSAAPKMLVMLGVSAAAVWLTDTRLLTALDPFAGGAGMWLSILITVLWIVVITNAFNFLDNMDGLSAGVAAICAAFLLVSALVSPTPQWFVAACLALLLGALLGFLVFNFPHGWGSTRGTDSRGGASIFQGDAGSLVVGFLLALLSVRITYLPVASAMQPIGDALTGAAGSATRSASLFPAVCTPLVVLAIPLYDLMSVTIIRLRQGKSPFVGDLQHFSHRLVRHGLSKRAAVVVIYGCTLVTAIGGVALPSLNAWQGALVLVQTAAVLCVLGLYEWAKVPGEHAGVKSHGSRGERDNA